MRFVLAAVAYIADPAHWSGAMGIGPLMMQHAAYSLAGVLIAALIGAGAPGCSRSAALPAPCPPWASSPCSVSHSVSV